MTDLSAIASKRLASASPGGGGSWAAQPQRTRASSRIRLIVSSVPLVQEPPARHEVASGLVADFLERGQQHRAVLPVRDYRVLHEVDPARRCVQRDGFGP